MAQYDTIVLSGSLLQWYVPDPDQRVVVYRHSIKYPYRPEGFEPLRSLFEVMMYPCHQYPDTYLFNSDLTKDHLERRLDIDGEVVYPPIATEDYGPAEEEEDFFLTVTRVTEGKRVDHLVDVFRDLDETLVVAGDGGLQAELEETSPENVEMVGYVSEERKRELLSRCRCFINHSGAELFGIAAAEALASGKPVLMAEGCFNHVIPGKNGYTYDRDGLESTILQFASDGAAWGPERIQEFARRHYGRDRFESQIREAVGTD